MSPRADTLVYVRKRLMALHRAGDGVLAMEREAMQWDWLERALPDRALPRGLLAAWARPLPSGRVALFRICTSGTMPHGVAWAVGVLVVESDAYAWLLQRIGTAVRDEAAWTVDGVVRMAQALPDWHEDQAGTAAPKVVDRLARGQTVVMPQTDDGSDATAQALAVVHAIGSQVLERIGWSVGLPVAPPECRLVQIAPALAPIGARLPAVAAVASVDRVRAGRPEAGEGVVPGSVTAAEARPAGSAAMGPPVELNEPFQIERLNRSRGDWVPAMCMAAMALALVFAWRMLSA